MNLALELLNLILELNHLGGDFVDLIVGGKQNLTVINKLHLNVIWAAM